MKKIIEIQEKVSFHWNNETKAIIATWNHFFIEENDFQSAIKDVLKFAETNKAKAWIVDASDAKSLCKPELFDKIKDNILPKLNKIGIKYYVTISPKESSFAKLTEIKYKQIVTNLGIANVEFENISSAIEWLKDINNN